MLIDRKARGWIVATLVLFLASTVLYIIYYHWSYTGRLGVKGPSGGSWVGLGYGIAGSAMILFAMALALKKRFRTLRVGRAYTWMQGHVWLGLLAYPMILYHAGFRWGQGPTVGLSSGMSHFDWQTPGLTWVLMWIFTFVIITGVLGLILQQYVPTKLLRDVPKETIYEQIDHVVEQLRAEAAELVAGAVSRKAQEAYEMEVVPAGAVALAPPPESVQAEQVIKAFYDQEVVPLLADRFPRGRSLSASDASIAAFRNLREVVPGSLRETVDDLESIVDERRQLDRQRRLQHVLHGWLLVHVPLSYAMFILAIVHAIWALRYTTIGA
jgi:hypothetical protein